MPRPRCHVPCSGRRPGRPPTPCSRSAAAAPAVAAHRRPACRRRPGGDGDATGAAVWPAAGCRLVDPAHQQRDVLPGDVLANGTVPTGAVGQCVGDRAQCLLAVAHLGVIRSDSMDDLAEGTVLHLQLDGGAHELVQCMCRVLRLRQTFTGRGKGVQLLGDNHRQKIVLGGEVPEDGALADPGALRDLRDRHLSALLGECLRRRVDQELLVRTASLRIGSAAGLVMTFCRFKDRLQRKRTARSHSPSTGMTGRSRRSRANMTGRSHCDVQHDRPVRFRVYGQHERPVRKVPSAPLHGHAPGPQLVPGGPKLRGRRADPVATLRAHLRPQPRLPHTESHPP